MKRVLLHMLMAVLVCPSKAQQAPTLSKQAASVKRMAESLSPQDKVSVIQLHAAEEYGTFVSQNAAGFTFYDIDQKRDVTLDYTEVKKIKRGYGGYNTVHRNHTDRTRNTVFVLVLVGLLAGIVAAAAAAK